MLLVVNAQKFPDSFLADDIKTDGWLIEEQDARFVNQGGDKLHLHPFAQR